MKKLTNPLRGLQETRRALCSWHNISDIPEVADFAEFAYEQCCTWFGTPQDHNWSYHIWQGAHSSCWRSKLLHMYGISIAENIRKQGQPDQLLEMIGHEMYHRVTYNSLWLRRQLWVDEMLAACTQQKLLGLKGYTKRFDSLDQYCLRSAKMEDEELLVYRPKRALFQGGSYVDTFFPTVLCIGKALESLTDWETMCLIPGCQDWREWCERTPQRVRPLIQRILPPVDSLASCCDDAEIAYKTIDLDSRRELAYAYFCRGNFAQAIKESQIAMELDPGNHLDYRRLGYIYLSCGDYQQSEEAWRQAIALKPDSPKFHFHLASALISQGKWQEAVEEYTITLSLKPNFPYAQELLETAKTHIP